MSTTAVKHDYHLVNPSPWPLVGSIALFVLAVGAVTYMKGLFGLPKGTLWLLLLGFGLVIFTMWSWWADVIKESRAGDHTPVVQIGLRYGVVLFIASEVMFFVAWFWAFFEMTIFHWRRAASPLEDVAAAWASWPPAGIETFAPFHVPLVNTLVLLLSGTTVTWAHHALQQGDREGAKLGLFLTVLLGLCFTALQVYEYSSAGFGFGGPTVGLYGSTFYMATGFHGAHVVIGTIFLAVCLFRLLMGGMSQKKHFGFEAAAWYWHFVDVVWLFLFTFVYVVFQ